MIKKARKSFDNDYICKYEWDEDCFCQCGDDGVVFCEESYITAFFEAFPKNPETFIRGEGKTVEEAETDAWEQLQRFKNCTNHEYERRGYKNGSGFCKHCGIFKSNVFEPSTLCIICNNPTHYSSDIDGNYYCEEHSELIPVEKRNPLSLKIKLKKSFVDIRNIENLNKTKEYVREFERRAVLETVDYDNSYKKEEVAEYVGRTIALDKYFNSEIKFSKEYIIKRLIATASILELSKLFKIEEYKYKDNAFTEINSELGYYYIVMENKDAEHHMLILTNKNVEYFKDKGLYTSAFHKILNSIT